MVAGKLPRKKDRISPTGTPGGSSDPSRPAWTSSEDPNLTLNDAQNRAADEFLARSRRNEPAITERLRDIADRTGANMEGLKYRLKEEESFKRKFAGALDEFDGDVDEALADMKDSVRYTLTLDSDRYTDGVQRSTEMMREAGFEPVKWKPSWGDSGYRGVNSFWRDPSTGQVFEAQFHTPESFSAKMETHGLYDEIRLLPEGDAERVRLENLQDDIFNRVPHPPGAENL
jgi:hypothetical protein